MYARFFGLRQQPFSIAPDPRYLFMSERHREALAHLLYGVRGGGGFVLLTGEIGAGKTTVCRCFLEQIPKRCNVAYIFNPKQTVEELLGSICDEFRIPRSEGAAPSAKQHVDALNDFLLRTHATADQIILCAIEDIHASPGVRDSDNAGHIQANVIARDGVARSIGVSQHHALIAVAGDDVAPARECAADGVGLCLVEDRHAGPGIGQGSGAGNA